jgi:hypothetical protein
VLTHLCGSESCCYSLMDCLQSGDLRVVEVCVACVCASISIKLVGDAKRCLQSSQQTVRHNWLCGFDLPGVLAVLCRAVLRCAVLCCADRSQMKTPCCTQ